MVVPNNDAVEFLGLDFSTLKLEALLAHFRVRPAAAPFRYVVTPNVDHMVRLHNGAPELWDLYRDAGYILCDSRILGRLASHAGFYLPVTPGSDLTRAVFENLLHPGDRICIIGASDRQRRELEARWPEVDFLQHIPPPGLLHNMHAMTVAAEFAAEAKARFTFFAVGSPQQELIARKVAALSGAGGLGLCIGASIDFLTDDQVRAPRWMQSLSLEWLHRLLNQPRRLWRRYLVDGPKIFPIYFRWRAHRQR